jgi:hypothetical protein
LRSVPRARAPQARSGRDHTPADARAATPPLRTRDR